MKFGIVGFSPPPPRFQLQTEICSMLCRMTAAGEVVMLWHKDKDLSMFTTDDCIVLPGGFSYGDYLRCGALARFSPMMEQVIDFAGRGERYWAYAMVSRSFAKQACCPAYCYRTITRNSCAKMYTSAKQVKRT